MPGYSSLGRYNSAPVSIGRGFLLRWPLLRNPRSLPDGQPDTRAVLHSHGEDFLRSPEIIAGVKQGIDFRAVPRPLLDLVEIAIIRAQRIVGLFVWLVVHVRRASSYGMFRYINAARQVIPSPVRLFRPWQPITPVDLPQPRTCEQDVITPGGAVVRLVDGKTALELARRDRRRSSLATLIANPPFIRATWYSHVTCPAQSSPRWDFRRQMDGAASQQRASQCDRESQNHFPEHAPNDAHS